MLTPAGEILSVLGDGKVPAKLRWRFEAATLPATSVARTTTRLKPTLSEMLQENDPLETNDATPLHVNAEKPDKASVTVPVTVTAPAGNDAPSVGEVTASAGMVLSMLSVTLAVAVSPLASVAVPLIT